MLPNVERIPAGDPAALPRAVAILRQGGVIVYPTDTLYGLGVDATNERAIDRLNTIKGRVRPVSVVAANVDVVLKWARANRLELDLIKEYLRGSTTLILPVRKNVVSSKIMGPGGTLGVRIPAHPFGPRLVEDLGAPVTTTSVNYFGEQPLNDPDLIEKRFGREVDLLVDDGPLPPSSGSTIYKLEKGKLSILRP